MMEMWRRHWACLAACAMAGSLLAGVASGAVSGKLIGKFEANVKTVERDGEPVNDPPLKREYRFNCLNSGCTEVRFVREGGDGTWESELTRTSPGVFKGTEIKADDDCPNSEGTGTREINHTVKIAEVSPTGKATRVTGVSRYEWPTCEAPATQTNKFSGRKT